MAKPRPGYVFELDARVLAEGSRIQRVRRARRSTGCSSPNRLRRPEDHRCTGRCAG